VPEGGVLPGGNVQPTVELDEVLRSLDARTRADLKLVVRELARGVGERGVAISDGAAELAPAAEAYEDVLGVLDAQRDAVTRLLRDGATTLGALGERRVATRALVRNLEDLVDVTARRERDLVRTVESLPPFLAELRRGMEVAERETARAGDVISRLRVAAPHVSPALRDVVALLPQLRGLLRDADPALRAARPGVPALTGVLRAAPPLMDRLHTAARDLNPVADYLHAYRHELMAPFMNVGAATQATFRSPGAEQPLHYLRVLIPFTGEGAVDKPERLPTNRHNAYMRPRALDRLKQGLESFDCGHLDNPQTSFVAGSAPRECFTQPPWRLADRPPRMYQRLTRDQP
jgi:ABC-type transporter Mla subunit MlaD